MNCLAGTLSFLAMLASCCPLLFRSQIIFCLAVKYPKLKVMFVPPSKT